MTRAVLMIIFDRSVEYIRDFKNIALFETQKDKSVFITDRLKNNVS